MGSAYNQHNIEGAQILILYSAVVEIRLSRTCFSGLTSAFFPLAPRDTPPCWLESNFTRKHAEEKGEWRLYHVAHFTLVFFNDLAFEESMEKKAVRGFVEAGEVMPKFEKAPSLSRTSPAHLTRPCAHAISFFSHICCPPLSLCTVNALVAVSMAGSVPVLCATSRSTVRSGECQTEPLDGWMRKSRRRRAR